MTPVQEVTRSASERQVVVGKGLDDGPGHMHQSMVQAKGGGGGGGGGPGCRKRERRFINSDFNVPSAATAWGHLGTEGGGERELENFILHGL